MNSTQLAASTEAEPEDFRRLPLDRVSIKPGFNTRTYIDPKGIEDMAGSIREAGGVLQPIVVRPEPERDGHYLIIAGERRYRAALLVGLGEIPAVVRDVSEKVALLLNGIENKERENLSAAEEAVLVRRFVDACDGDRDEAARCLGFSRKVVDARLLLLHATPAVRDALAARRIKIGHAELLATLPADKQDKGLESVLAKSMPVEELRRHVDLYALSLKAAIFDTAGCNDCPHNTSLQASLFSEHVGDGRCTNRSCYEDKRAVALKAMKDELLETYPVVWTDLEKEAATYTLVVKNGPRGVGTDQYQACLGCASYGVLMSTRPGEEGRVTPGTCFDVDCNRKKVSDYQASIKTTDAGNDMSLATTSGDNRTAARGTTKATKKHKARAKSVPKRIEHMIHRFWRDTAALAVADHPRVALCYAVYALAHLAGGEGRDKVLRAAGLKSSDFRSDQAPKAVEALLGLDDTVLQTLLNGIAQGYVRDTVENGYGKDMPVLVDVARRTLKHCATPLGEHFVLSKEYLSAHTISGIESLMGECGFDKWYAAREKDDKAFQRLMNGKHDKIVKTILASGFDFKGFVPKSAQT